MTTIYTPRQSIHAKTSVGITDVTVVDNVYKFMGCSILSINATNGWNGTASSCQVTLVEDIINGDSFINPEVPRAFAIHLPNGGIGAEILYPSGINLAPNGLYPSNCPFFFTGLCQSWGVTQRSTSAKTISVSLVDVRDLCGGIQCLLGNFAPGQNGLSSLPRYSNVDNIIDIFGYYNYGYNSGKTHYGITWQAIQNVIENVGVTVNGVNIEFFFSGECFNNVPDWYRIGDDTIDLLALVQRVCADGGSDLALRCRKINDTDIIAEFVGIRRFNLDPIYQTEIDDFISDRAEIVVESKVGKEYRNEPTSSVVVGGMRNSNYVARPTQYDATMHLTGGKENYHKFPNDIKVRLFGGTGTIINDPGAGGNVSPTTQVYTPNVGSIFPFWGFASLSGQDPMAEPFLSLDHLVFDRESQQFAQLSKKIPLCDIRTQFTTVRTVAHDDLFLDGDGNSDSRPFGYIHSYSLNAPFTTGKVRGLPLNTEVLRAALVSEDTFYSIYSIHYPDIASGMRVPAPDWRGFRTAVETAMSGGMPFNIEDAIESDMFLSNPHDISITKQDLKNSADEIGRITKTAANPILGSGYFQDVIAQFRTIIYNQVRQYADDHCGRKFVVCLPRSEIMNRIWTNQVVPTQVEKPEIEYIVDDLGYWENVPPDFDGIGQYGGSGVFSSDQELQIVRRFADINGRFNPMVAIDWKPSGNINFNSNGINKAMFQDLPISDFRPNSIASGNPSHIFLAPSNIQQLTRRPDLALVDIPAMDFDPLDSMYLIDSYNAPSSLTDEFVANRGAIVKFLLYYVKTNNDLRTAIREFTTYNGGVFDTNASNFINKVADRIYAYKKNFYRMGMIHERVMDLNSIIIPLTSTFLRYGPWFYDNTQADGMVNIDIDESLVPWNFERSNPWNYNLDQAGFEKVARSLSVIDYVDNANIVCAGFPEYGIGDQLGFNSNLTTVVVDFGIDGVKTTYNFATYAARAGTYRKGDYDNVQKARIDVRPRIVDPSNFDVGLKSIGGDSASNRFIH